MRYAPAVTTSVVVPLVGVVLGALGALLGVYLSNRVTKKQAEDSRTAALRTERKKAIVAFLNVAQSVEEAVEQRYLHATLPDDWTSRIHKMWFRQKCIELVCNPAVNEKTIEYAKQIHGLCYKELQPNVPVWDLVEETRLPFLATARQDLGIPKSWGVTGY